MDNLVPFFDQVKSLLGSYGKGHIDDVVVCCVGHQSCGKTTLINALVPTVVMPIPNRLDSRTTTAASVNVPNSNAMGGGSNTAATGGDGGCPVPADNSGGVFPVGVSATCPMVARLHHNTTGEEWATFLHKPTVRYTNIFEIRAEFANESVKSGSRPIILELFSPHVIDITLVDLPPLPKSDFTLRKAIIELISNPNCIVITVNEAQLSANVISKIDLLGKDVDAMAVWEKSGCRGCIGVVCHNTRYEQQFLQHSVYHHRQQMGVSYLQKTLYQIIVEKLKAILPDVKIRVNIILEDTRSQLEKYNQVHSTVICDKGALLLQHLTKFSTELSKTIDGTMNSLSLVELTGGARINYVINEIFAAHVFSLHAMDGITDQDLLTAIRNSTGTRTALFLSETSFEVLIKKQIQKLLAPSIQCCEMVHEELVQTTSKLATQHLSLLPRLCTSVIETTNSLLNTNLQPTRQMIEYLIKIELAYLNTSHPDFSTSQILRSVLSPTSPPVKVKPLTRPDIKPISPVSASAKPTITPSPAPPTPTSTPTTTSAVGLPPMTPNQVYQCPICGIWFEELKVAHKHIDGCIRSTTKKERRRSRIASALFGHSRVSTTTASRAPAPPSSAGPPLDSSVATSHLEPQQPPEQEKPTEEPEEPENPDPIAIQNEMKLFVDDPTVGEKDSIQVKLIGAFLEAYFTIVQKNIADTVPKAIMHFLVYNTLRNLHTTLVSSLYNGDNDLSQLLKESPQAAQQMAQIKEQMTRCNKAITQITSLREFHV
ncbi:sorting nexin-7 [Pelomyxa schiedti]|nr:sorting nexin-7 [Pelomyxa schiedti]